MSVLNQSGEEQVECPLCMEPLEVDDLNFFPCTCGYQVRMFYNENFILQRFVCCRYVVFAGIELERMRTVCVRLVVKLIPKIQLILRHCRKNKWLN